MSIIVSKAFYHPLGAGSPGYTYLGCFKDYLQGSPYGGGYRSLPVVSSRPVGWTVDQCAVLARDRGFPVFSLQFQMECWMGAVADVARMTAASLTAPDADCSAVPCGNGGSCLSGRNKVFVLEGTPPSDLILDFSQFIPRIALLSKGLE